MKLEIFNIGRVVLLMFVALVFGLAACSDDSKSNNVCESGERFAEVNAVEGCYTICDQGQCSGGAICTSNICVPQGGNNVDSNNGATNNGDTNNGDPNNGNPNNGDTNNVIPDLSAEELCIQACDRYYGSCIADNCTLTSEWQTGLTRWEADCLEPEDGSTTCAERVTDDPDYRTNLERIVALACDEPEIEMVRCGFFGLTEQCGCSVPTNLGAACTDDTSCDGGSLHGYCIAENQEGSNVVYPGGVCYARECPNIAPSRTPPYYYETSVCGAGNFCGIFSHPQGGVHGICQPGCGNCRDGYGCAVFDFKRKADPEDTELIRGCWPECTSNSECPSTRCLDGACAAPCAPGPIAGIQGNPSWETVCVNSGGTCINDWCHFL